METRREQLLSQLETARAFVIETLNEQYRFRLEFARTSRPVRPRADDAVAMHIYNNRMDQYQAAQNELERRIRSVEQAETMVRFLEQQLDDLDQSMPGNQNLAIESTNDQTLQVQEVDTSASDGSQGTDGSDEEEPVVDTDSDEERNQALVIPQSGQFPATNTPDVGSVATLGSFRIRRRNVPQPIAAANDPLSIGPGEENSGNNDELQDVQEQTPDAGADGQTADAESVPKRTYDIEKYDCLYKNFWDNDATREWMSDAENYLVGRSREADFDYQSFDTRVYFSRLEEYIAQNIFGIDENLAERALNRNNFLLSFDTPQRKTARNLRKKLEKIGGKQDLQIQAVPFVLREDKMILWDRKDSRYGCVFRVKCHNDRRKYKFLDREGRTYDSWKDFLEKNKLSKGMMAFISEGFLRREPNAENPQRNVPVKFCETPPCSLVNRGLNLVTKGVNLLAPASSILFFWNPIGWVGSAVSIFVLAYSIAGNCYTIYDKATHSENFGIDILHLITTIGTIVAHKAVPRYLKSVAKAHRDLTKLERIIITSFLVGMCASQVFSFVGTLYTFATKPDLTPLDVLNFVVSCQNLYSAFITPKSAESMLEQVRVELASEEFQNLTTEQANEQKLTAEISELQRKIERTGSKDEVKQLQQQLAQKRQKLQNCVAKQKTHQDEFQAFKSPQLEQAHRKKLELKKLEEDIKTLHNQLETLEQNSPDAAALKADIRRKNAEFNNCEKQIIGFQKEHQQEIQKGFKNDGVKQKCQEFINAETNKCSPKRKVDQNGRVIQAMYEMDAEMVFTMASEEQTKIRFTNGEELTLAINDQFDIHPRAIKQLDRISTSATNERNKETDLRRVFSKTRDFNAKKLDKIEYLLQMREMLEPYDMISRAEIDAFGRQMRQNQGKWWFSNSRFDKLPPAEALRLRKAMESIRANDKTNVVYAAELLAKNLNYSDSYRLADCIDIVNKTVEDKLVTFKEKISTAGATNIEMVKICREVLNASDAQISQLQKEGFSKNAVRSMTFKQLTKPGEQADSLAKTMQKRLEDVEKTYFGENSSLPFTHPLSAVCHEMEYGPDYTKKYATMSQADRNSSYFKNIPEKTFSGKNTSFVSQDGMTITRTWTNSKGFFGKTTSSYAAEHDSNHPMHKPEVWVQRYARKITRRPQIWTEQIVTQSKNPTN